MNAAEALEGWLTHRVSAVPYGQGRELLVTPWDFEDGATVTMLVERLGSDHYLLTDRGLVADRLADCGVDLDRPAPSKSWAAIRDSLPRLLAEPSPFELAATASSSDLGQVAAELASRMMQAEGLNVLGHRRRPSGFSASIMRQASEAGLATIPRAKVTNKHGGKREVSFGVRGERDDRFVVALSGQSNSFMPEHDRAKIAFDDVINLAVSQKVVALSSRATPQAWQLASLREVASVVEEHDLPSLWADMAAA